MVPHYIPRAHARNPPGSSNRAHCLFPDSHLGWEQFPAVLFRGNLKISESGSQRRCSVTRTPHHTRRKPARAGETLLLLDAALLLQGCSCRFSCKPKQRLQTLQTGSTRDCSNLACHDPQELRTLTFTDSLSLHPVLSENEAATPETCPSRHPVTLEDLRISVYPCI